MNRIYSVENGFYHGFFADHRLRVKASEVHALLMRLQEPYQPELMVFQPI